MNEYNLSETAIQENQGGEIWEHFQQQAELKCYPPETIISQQADAFRNIYLIERGIVKFMRSDESGNEMIIEIRSSGDLIGAAGAICQNLAPVSAVTLTECHIYHLPVETFLAFLEANNAFLRATALAISQQYYAQMTRLARLGTASARSNLAYLMLRFVNELDWDNGHEVRLHLPYNRTTIAKLLAVNPSYLGGLPALN